MPSPSLSVIVPMYDVEDYLAECLESLAAQSFGDLEVVMVDDGSTDHTAHLAAKFAESDDRFRLVRQANAGLGAARNAGLRAISAGSAFLAFVDSDDVIPPDAYRMMVSSLRESGSDFASGNVLDTDGTRTWQSPMFRALAGNPRRNTHISEMRHLTSDRIACNKVFRRDFWEANGFSFPEGVYYEDISVVLPAHFLARSIDVIAEPVYLWRQRTGSGAPSITQRRTEPKAVIDRVAAVSHVSRFLAEHADPRIRSFKPMFDRSVLTSDLRTFMNVLPDGDADYRAAFMESVNDFLDGIDPRIALGLPVAQRVKWILVRKHATDDLIAMLRGERLPSAMETSGRLGRRFASFPALRDSAVRIPRRVLRVDSDLEMRAPLTDIAWRDGRLELAGDAWIDRVDIPSHHHSMKVLQLKRGGSRRRIVLPLHNRYHPERTALSGRGVTNLDWAGWSCSLDPKRLRQNGAWREGVWHVGIGLAVDGLFRRRAVSGGGGGRPGHPPYHWVSEDHRVLPFLVRSSLRIRVERVRCVVTGYHAESADLVRILGEVREPVPAGTTAVLRATVRTTGEVRDFPVEIHHRPGEAAEFSAEVDLPSIAFVPMAGDAARPRRAKESTWSTSLLLTRPDGTERALSTVVADGVVDAQFALAERHGEEADGRAVALLAGSNGYLKLACRKLSAIVERVAFTDGAVTVSGTLPETGLTSPVLVLRAHGRFEEREFPVEAGFDGSFTVAFRPSRVPGLRGVVPLKTGRWLFRLRSADGGRTVPLKIDRRLVHRFPVRGTADCRGYDLEARWYDSLELYCHSELSDTERGPYRLKEMQERIYRPALTQPVRDSVLYFSYNGKQFSDSPKAIFEELSRRGAELDHLWVVRDGQVVLPDGVQAVRMWGPEWVEALARSRYVVTNGHLPSWMRRREGQFVVQTWHGTMLKKIGHDIETPKFDPTYQDRLREETRVWDVIISSNEFSTPILRRAFDFAGPIVETGYPRNDCLYAPDRDERAGLVRERLGIPAGRKVVLYAPTWRDDRTHGGASFQFDLRLDLDDARKRLGSDHVLLIRKHSNVVDNIPGAGDGFVFDVSDHPDIADLYLAADILVTDYSSVMFDYAHLRRPMLFFTYDLDHYRDDLRGFYFDFETDAPGPLIRTSEELVTAIADIDQVRAQYADRYEEFHRTFCGLDDGHAARRVVDLMLRRGRER